MEKEWPDDFYVFLYKEITEMKFYSISAGTFLFLERYGWYISRCFCFFQLKDWILFSQFEASERECNRQWNTTDGQASGLAGVLVVRCQGMEFLMLPFIKHSPGTSYIAGVGWNAGIQMNQTCLHGVYCLVDEDTGKQNYARETQELWWNHI